MGLYMLPEFLGLSEHQQNLMKWVILLHDVEKEPQEGKRDYTHAFRSAVGAAKTLPGLGFPITSGRALLLRTGYLKIVSMLTGLGMLGGGLYGLYKTLFHLFADN